MTKFADEGAIQALITKVKNGLSGKAASSHSHGAINNAGKLTDTAADAASNDKVVLRDSGDDGIRTSTIKGTDVADAVSKKHSHSTLTLSTTAQAYDGSHTLKLPASDPYSSARTPSSHTHGNITNTGTVAEADSPSFSTEQLITRGTDGKIKSVLTTIGEVGNAVSNMHSHSSLTLSKTAQTYDGTHTLQLPSFDPYTTQRTPASHTHGNIQNGGTLQTSDITIASGDKLVVTDASDSNKIARASVSFDGSTTSKALTKKGTFEDFASPNDFTHLSDKGVLDLSSLNTDKWYPVLFRNYYSGSAEKPSIIHTIVWVEFDTYTATWSSHSGNSFTCYSEWKEWPANGGESQRIKYVENSYYHWTDKPPVVHRDSLDYGTFSVVYLRGGTKYNYVTVKGAEVLLKTSSYTESNITYSPLSYSDFTQYETSLGSKCIGTEGIACGKSFDQNNPWFIRQANFVNGLVSNNIMYFGQYADPLYINSADGGTSLDMRSSGGAIVTVRGTNHTDPGAFVLTAHSGSTYKQFRGGPDGSLTWDSERIPTSPDASVLKIVKLTQQQYDALTTKDSTTLYIII